MKLAAGHRSMCLPALLTTKRRKMRLGGDGSAGKRRRGGRKLSAAAFQNRGKLGVLASMEAEKRVEEDGG